VESSIQVGVSGPAVWVKVEGRGNFLNSGNLKEFAREMVDRGYREFIVDLANCAMMDSTFMGTMAGMALRLKELGQGHLHIVHCGTRSHEQSHTMLEAHEALCEAAPENVPRFKDVLDYLKQDLHQKTASK